MAKFKTRARTVDMLGKQQIAGIPTAISELFKNAYDAYADRVEIDYYRSDELFILRDDGIGMTKDEFEEKWLTLGTESKLDSNKTLPLLKDPEKPFRPVLGEKGIGRLAIASIGPQVLVLSRAIKDDKTQNIVAAFINWRLFELPGIDLDEIVIPIETYEKKVPSNEDVRNLVSQVENNIDSLLNQERIEKKKAKEILEELKHFTVNPMELYEEIGEPNLSENNRGTHFFIKPAYDTLQDAIEGEKWKKDTAPPLIKTLIGFSNTITSDEKNPSIITSFRYHKTDEDSKELISADQFFTTDEFQMADHHVQGEFDEYGQFRGTVLIYKEEPITHVIPWQKAKGRATKCGPFQINFAYVQGNSWESMLTPEEYALIGSKLDRIGGIYIYKDKIRILPYGDTDYDWLDIEKNRTKSAGYYFFSYRRMFGYIDISRDNNNELMEKAGREGFQENKAYRQFREILATFFIQLAADFFRDIEKGGGPNAEIFGKYKTEYDRLHKAQMQRDRKRKEKKNELIEELNNFFKMIENKEPESDVDELLKIAKTDFIMACGNKLQDRAIVDFLEVENNSRKKVDEIRNKYTVAKTRGFASTKQMNADYNAYLIEFKRLEDTLFIPTLKEIEEIGSEILTEYKLDVSQRRRLENAIHQITDNAKKSTNMQSKQTRELVNEVKEKIVELTREILSETDQTIRATISEFEKIDTTGWTDDNIVKERTRLEEKIENTINKNKEILESIRDQLENVAWEKTDGGEIITVLDMTEAMESELINLRDKAEIDMELTQLGLALGIIHHEFGGTIKTIRTNIKRLKAWSDVNEGLEPLYTDIRNSFEHLDGYLTLFTPLNRRLYRKEIEITGSAICQFLEDIFSERMKRHKIKLIPTTSFKKKRLVSYPSTFYPVFVNLIDNAIFWLKDHKEPREIILDADETCYYVSNNGPELNTRDREIIFEYGFTRKPNGRGLGLYISRAVLEKVGYEISLTTSKIENGVTFCIRPSDKLGEND